MSNSAELAALLEKGASLYASGQSAAAAVVYRRALQIAPKDPTVRLRHALAIWHGENKAEEALAIVSDLVRKFPQAPVLAAEALILGSMGRFADSARAARRAVTADPGYASAWIDLATATPETDAADLADELSEVLKRKWTDGIRRQLHFARATALRKAGSLEAAFDEAANANALVERRWNAEHERAFHTQLRSIFSSDLMAQLDGKGHPDPRPIFIVGMPRSGTTLLEQMLGEHTKIETVGETPIIGNLFNQLQRQVGRDPAKIRASLTPNHLHAIGAAVLKGFEGRLCTTHQARIIDKMPANHLFLPFIALIFPNAHILHMQRHPLDTCLSCWEASFSFGLDYAADLTTLGQAWRQYHDLNQHWIKILGNRVRTIQYEDLVRTPEDVLEPVVSQLGLQWDPACLRPGQSGSIKTASVAQARGPINTRSVGRWKVHRKRLSPLIEAIGGIDWIERIAPETSNKSD